MQYLSEKAAIKVEGECKNAADFSIVIEGVPADINRVQLEEAFHKI